MSETMTRDEYLAATAPAKRRNKYGAKKTVVDGITFDSAAESRRYATLRQMEQAELISHLERQPTFKLYCGTTPILIKSKRYPNGRHMTYRADFAYFDPSRNKRIVEDVKGRRTKEFIIKKAVVEACFPAVEIVEVSA